MSTREDQEHFVIMAEELALRRGNDPLRSFQLHDRQRAFVDSVLQVKKKENWFIAANRAGKSDAGAYCGATLARFGHPGDVKWATGAGTGISVRDRATSGWVSALDFPTSRDVIQPKYFNNGFRSPNSHEPFIPAHEIAEWRIDDQILKLKNGSLIGFKSAESGPGKYQGAGKDWIHFDEEHPFSIYEESVIRVGEAPLLFFCTCTLLPPEGQKAITVSWIFDKVVNPWKEGRAPNVGLFGSSIYDNPHIMRSEIARLESIYPEGSVSRRIRLDGEMLPGLSGARAYPAFDRMLHVKEQPKLSMRRPLIWTWDFNVEPMCSVVGQVDGLMYRVYRELYLDEGNISEMCSLFCDLFPRHGAEIWLYGDSTGKGRTGQTGRSDYWMILNEMKQYGAPIRMRVPPENPRVPDRINAVNRVCKDEEGHVRLSVDPLCRELIADLEGVKRDSMGKILKVRNRTDPYFKRTHLSDALGYWLAFDEPVRPVDGRGSVSNSMSPRVNIQALMGPQYGIRH